MTQTKTAQEAIAEYFQSQSDWRSLKAGEHSEDQRNDRCAEGLHELAQHVLTLTPEDPRLVELDALAVHEDIFMPPAGWTAEHAISRFRFHDPREDCDRFLTWLVGAVRKDNIEWNRELGESPLHLVK